MPQLRILVKGDFFYVALEYLQDFFEECFAFVRPEVSVNVYGLFGFANWTFCCD